VGRVVWHNGNLIPEAEARVSIYDSALMFGDMVFEMTRSFHGVHFKLDEHLDRLFRSAELTHQTVPYTKDELKSAIALVTEENAKMFQPDDEHRLLINVSRGVLGMYDGLVDVPSGPQVMIADFPLRWTMVGMSRFYDEGVAMRLIDDPGYPIPTAKHRSRLAFQLGNAQVRPGEWPLFHDSGGWLRETSGANIFLVQGTIALTPHEGCLPGISAGYIADIGNVSHARVNSSLIPKCDELFVSATPFCLLPVTKVNDVPVGDGNPGPIYRRLLALWSENVDVDIAAQARSWDAVPRTRTGPSTYAFR